MGDSRKYPYPTTGGMSILTPPCPRKFQNAYPPLALRIPKSLTPPLSSGIFHFCFRPFGIPVRLPKSSIERETCTFSHCKRILFTIFSQTIKQIIETQEKSGPNCIFPLNTGFRFEQQMFLGLCKYFCRATHNMHVQII